MNRSPVRFWEAAPTKLWPSKPLIGPAWSCPGRRFGHFRSAHAPLLARAVHDAGSRRPTPDEHSPDELRCTGTVSNKQRGGAEVMRGGSSERTQIGRASCRERVEETEVDGTVKKKKRQTQEQT